MLVVTRRSRGCLVWMQRMIGQLPCEWFLEGSDAQNAQEVSLATPTKLSQAVKVDVFQLEDSHRKGFFAFHMDEACNLAPVFLFSGRESSTACRPKFSTLISHLAKDLMQHFPQFHFLIFDPGGCFVSNELGVWASVRGIGLLTSPGEFHGLTVVLENLIRPVERLARKLSEDRP